MSNEDERISEPGWIAVAAPSERRLRTSARRRRRRRRGWVVLSAFLALVIIAGVVAGGYLWSLGRTFDQRAQSIPHPFPDESSRPQRASEDKALNFLLLGSDSRDESQSGQDSAINVGRSDTIMLIHISADRRSVTTTSILRDTWVSIPGHGKAKLNAAFSYGGIPLAVETIEKLFGARIDHVATIDFEGFTSLVDSVGGVEIHVPVPFTGEGNRRFEGKMQMNGSTALEFVRQRKQFVDGDYQRVRNQQMLMKAVLDKVISPGVLLNPGTVNRITEDMAPFLGFDDSISAWSLSQLGVSLREIRPSSIVMFTLPTDGTGRSPDGKQSIVLPSEKAIKAFSEALKKDDVAGYARSLSAAK